MEWCAEWTGSGGVGGAGAGVGGGAGSAPMTAALAEEQQCRAQGQVPAASSHTAQPLRPPELTTQLPAQLPAAQKAKPRARTRPPAPNHSPEPLTRTNESNQ